jgi:4-hydroxy 2-oxovalerate aldolase
MRIIDCTFRDGGHLNKWNFPDELVKDTYLAAVAAGVDFFEVGYRNIIAEGYGKYSYCDDNFIAKLLGTATTGACKLLVMVDTSKYRSEHFAPAVDSPFWGVRVAAYPHELEQAFVQIEELLAKGYHVFLNPMVTSALTEYHIESIGRFVRTLRDKGKALEAVYIADSFGSLHPQSTVDLIEKVRTKVKAPLGFHAHNNLQMALTNTLAAMAAGVKYVDATLHGMGRGAGNVPIEILLGVSRLFDLDVDGAYDLSRYLFLVDGVNDLGLSWGASPLNVLGGLYGVHSNYMEEFQGCDLARVECLLRSIKFPVTYDPNFIKTLKEDIG